jgi:enoyl-CoA hydratase
MISERNFRVGYLTVERSTHVATVLMKRPEKLNAMTPSFWRDLREVLDLLAADRETRVVIVTGAGEKAFSAGGDIVGFTELKTIEDMRMYQVDAMSTFAHVEQCPLIVIAAVNGLAFGGGCELALACDIVIASDAATSGWFPVSARFALLMWWEDK